MNSKVIKFIGIFGSYARDSQSPSSDIDILARFDEGATLELAEGLGITLLIWSVGSIVVGFGLFIVRIPILQGIGLMFILWGIIDLLITMFTLKKQKDSPATELAKILLINVGLDVIYQVIGIILVIFGLHDTFVVGSSLGIILQGAFLFFLDLVYYRRMNRLIPTDETV